MNEFDDRERRAPARLDEQLVAELTKRPDFENVVSTINDMGDFFLSSALAEFSVPSPAELHARGADGHAVARAKLMYFHRLLILRAAELLPNALRSMNESRLVSFALAARGVLETAAVGAYHARRLAIDDSATTLPDDYWQRLRAAVLAGRFDWLRFFKDHAERLSMIYAYDNDPSKQLPPDLAANILTMLDVLGKRLRASVAKARGIVLHDYALLSDLSHPSAGSNLVFLAEAGPRMRAELVPQRVTCLGIAELLLPCVAYSANALVEVLAELEALDERIGKMAPAAAPAPSKEGGGA